MSLILNRILNTLPFRAPLKHYSLTQGAALGYVLHWAFLDIIGCGSAIQASLIAFALHDDSARLCCKKRNIKLHTLAIFILMFLMERLMERLMVD